MINLLINTGSLKDLIGSMVTIESVAQKEKSAKFDVLVKKGNESLLDNHPLIKEILIWDPEKSNTNTIVEINSFIHKQKYHKIYTLSQSGVSKSILKGIERIKIKSFDSPWKKLLGIRGNYYPKDKALPEFWVAFGKLASDVSQSSAPKYYITAKEQRNTSPLKRNDYTILLMDEVDLETNKSKIKQILESIPNENAIYQWSRYAWKHPKLPLSKTVLNLSEKLSILEVLDLMKSGNVYSFNSEYNSLKLWINL